jgi:hypothetical protein
MAHRKIHSNGKAGPVTLFPLAVLNRPIESGATQADGCPPRAYSGHEFGALIAYSSKLDIIVFTPRTKPPSPPADCKAYE